MPAKLLTALVACALMAAAGEARAHGRRNVYSELTAECEARGGRPYHKPTDNHRLCLHPRRSAAWLGTPEGKAAYIKARYGR